MGQPHRATLDDSRCNKRREQTSGSKTFQYREEKRPTGIPLVAASETGKAQTQPQSRIADSGDSTLGMGVIRLQCPALSRIRFEKRTLEIEYVESSRFRKCRGKVKKC